MIIYNGSNQLLKQLLSPHEKNIEKAIFDMLGRDLFKKLETGSNELLKPNAFIEPEQIIKKEKNDIDLNDDSDLNLLGYANDLLFLNEIIADEIAFRICSKIGINYTLNINAENDLKPSRDVISRKPKDGFTDIIVNWNRYIMGKRRQDQRYNKIITSLEEINYHAMPLPKNESIDLENGKFLVSENDYMFGLSIRDISKIIYEEDRVKLKNANRITSNPQFILPKTYIAKPLHPEAHGSEEELLLQFIKGFH